MDCIRTPKYTRVDEIEGRYDQGSCTGGQSVGSFVVSRDSVKCPEELTTFSNNDVRLSKLKLRDLMGVCKVFQHPQKVQKLR